MPDVSDAALPLSPRQLEVLLSLSQDIATIRNKVDLLQVIVTKIKPLFNFYDCGILVIDKYDRFHDLAAIHPEIDDSAVNHLLKEQGFYQDKGLPYANSPLKWVIEQIEEAKSPVLFDYTADYTAFSNHSLLETLRTSGYKEAVAGVLKTGGQVFGCFTINYLDQHQAKQVQLSLFQHVIDQLSVAVANILANEDILAREREKTVLLNITQAIAAVNDKVTLLRTIFDLIQPVFRFDDLGLAILDPDKRYVTDWSASMPGLSGSSVNAVLYTQQLASMDYPGTLLEYTIENVEAQGQPLVMPLTEELAAQWPDAVYLPVEIEDGLKECLFTTLKTGGQLLGSFNLNSKQAGYLATTDHTLFQAIADQIAVAVANILANEEILEREQEKSALLSVCEAIASVRGKEMLLTLIVEKIKPLFNFYDCGLFIFDGDKRYLEDLTVSFPAISPSTINQRLADDSAAKFLVAGSPWELLLHRLQESGGPLIYQYKEERPVNWQDYVQASFIDQAGYEESMMSLLKIGGETIGVFSINTQQKDFFRKKQYHVFQAICDQLAVAVANILANEAIDRQFREITTLKKRVEAENVYLQEEVKSLHNFEEIIGNSAALHECLIKVGMVARTPSTVLIGGETGTGKELIARAIHNLSDRRAKSLIKINCASLPRELIESELFGHERGAFTGAIDKRIGKFELANGSTLFLDEIGELPLEVQAKLLRAIQEREIERLGGNRVITVDVRIIVATNRDLGREVQAGRFRADLFYRLNVFPITLPPLRERRDDIPVLAAHFVQKSAKKMGKTLNGISPTAMQSLLRYHFPGNIRELEHIIERGAILATGRTLHQLYLPTSLPAATAPTGEQVLTLAEQERSYILTVLEQCGGRVSGPSGAARLLGLPASTLESKMKKLGITKLHKATE